MLERVIKKRRLEHGSQKRWSHPHSSTRRLDALAANPNPSPNPSLLPNLNPLLQTIPATASAAALNLSPIVSAVSAPSWMSMSSPPTTATSSPTPTSAGQATATPAPGNAPDRTSTTHSSGDASSTVNSGPLPRTASNYVSCSGSSQCVTITSTVIPTSSSTSSPNGSGSAGGVNAFFASLGSSAGSIFVTTLVGLAILGVIFAISSWGLRRWCNRRRKKIIDDDTWKFLNVSQLHTRFCLHRPFPSFISVLRRVYFVLLFSASDDLNRHPRNFSRDRSRMMIHLTRVWVTHSQLHHSRMCSRTMMQQLRRPLPTFFRPMVKLRTG